MSPNSLALLSILLWASLATVSVQLKALPALLLVGLALLIGGIAGALFKLKHWRQMRCAPMQLLLGIYGLFAYHLLLFLAFRFAPPLEANLINYLWPLLIVLLAPLFKRGMRLTGLHLLAAALGFVGAALLISGGKLAFDMQYALGYACALAAALVWSTYSLASGRYAGTSSSIVTLYCLASGALSLAAHALLEPRYLPTTGQWAWLLVLGLGPMGLAFFTWDAALKRGDARVIGSLSYLTPLLSTVLLVTFGIGQFTWVSAGAMALIMAGAVLGTLASSANAAPHISSAQA
jgi:drug/metabolite transporter (DMT)-like permease